MTDKKRKAYDGAMLVRGRALNTPYGRIYSQNVSIALAIKKTLSWEDSKPLVLCFLSELIEGMLQNCQNDDISDRVVVERAEEEYRILDETNS